MSALTFLIGNACAPVDTGGDTPAATHLLIDVIDPYLITQRAEDMRTRMQTPGSRFYAPFQGAFQQDIDVVGMRVLAVDLDILMAAEEEEGDPLGLYYAEVHTDPKLGDELWNQKILIPPVEVTEDIRKRVETVEGALLQTEAVTVEYSTTGTIRVRGLYKWDDTFVTHPIDFTAVTPTE